MEKYHLARQANWGNPIKAFNWRPKRDIRPHPAFRTMVGMSVLNGWAKPFALSAEFPYALNIAGQKLNSISSNIAGVDGAPTDFYRPDWSIRMTTIPTVSMIDVIDKTVPIDSVRGKDVIVGPTAAEYNDIHRIAGQGWVPGCIFMPLARKHCAKGRRATGAGFRPGGGGAVLAGPCALPQPPDGRTQPCGRHGRAAGHALHL
jgi:hypothetical protein